MKNKPFSFLAVFVIALLSTSSAQPPANKGPDLVGTGHIIFLDHKWSFVASVIRVEQVSALGSRGHAALLTYLNEDEGNASYAWVLLDLEGYDYHCSDTDISAGQKVLLYVSGNYVDERGIDYDRCSNEAGDYCTVLTLVEGAYPKSIDMNNLPMSPGNELIHHGSSSRNWWTGMLAWKISVQ